MKKIRVTLAFMVLLLLVGWRPVEKGEVNKKDIKYFNRIMESLEKADYARDHVLIKLRGKFNLQKMDILREYRLKEIGYLPDLNWIIARVPEGKTVKDVIRNMFFDERVAYVEPDYVLKAFEVTPNDPLFHLQWYLYNDGTFRDGSKPGADIEAPKGWEYETGSEAVIVAVVDTGVDYDHPDLEDKVIKGYDFVNEDEDPMDDNGHGTMVAGVVAAKTNNNKGIAGVCWGCKVLAVKVLDKDGLGLSAVVAFGIKYAVDHGAKVINLSLGGPYPSKPLMEAVDYAYQANVLVVAASGNENSFVYYPAAYSPKCISVGATDYFDERADFSNYGANLDVVAPGVFIATLYPTWADYQYVYANGTSLAAPIVSGIAGLLFSKKPGLSVDDARKIILYTAEDINKERFPGKDVYLGYGRVNLYQLLKPIKLE